MSALKSEFVELESEIASVVTQKEAQLQNKKYIKMEYKQKIVELSEKVLANAQVSMPQKLSIEDIIIANSNGREFANKEVVEFVKHQIVEVFASSQKIRDELDLKLQIAIEKRINKKVSVAVIESQRSSNTFTIYRLSDASDIMLKINGLEISVWTVD